MDPATACLPGCCAMGLCVRRQDSGSAQVMGKKTLPAKIPAAMASMGRWVWLPFEITNTFK